MCTDDLDPQQLAVEIRLIQENRTSRRLQVELMRRARVLLQREFKEELLAAAVSAALHWGEAHAIHQLVDSLPPSTPKMAWSPYLGLMTACRRGEPSEVEQWLSRLSMGAAISPGIASTLCEELSKGGLHQHLRRILSCCDLGRASGKDVLRLSKVCRRIEDDGQYPRVRVWLAGMVTMDLLVPAIELGLWRHGFSPMVRSGRFGMMHQDLRDPQGEAARFHPDFVVLGYEVEDIVPQAIQARHGLSNIGSELRQGVDRLANSIRTWRVNSPAAVILHTVTRTRLCSSGWCDWLRPEGAASVQMSINRAVAELCNSVQGVYLADVADLAGTIGSQRFLDERRRLYGRFPASADGMAAWGGLLADLISVAKRGARKVVICDLDDTLWGGIVGDVGPMGVQVGPDYPGNAFLEFQHILVHLRSQGVLLALCSKNDPETALSVLRNHPHMAVRLEDIAAYRIGWGSKVGGIVELAEELNLGLDSFVFLDDSVQERAAVRQALPMVLTPDLPADPVDRPAFLRCLRDLWPVSLTDTDLQRSEMYQAQSRRKQLAAELGSVEEFLRSLGQVLTVGPVTEGQWGRVAQMHQRTNQFNMTNRRHDESTLRRLCSRGAVFYTGSLADCFGDQGIVITALIVPEGERWRIDTLLMSCRVMGRQVECALMQYLASQAQQTGIQWIDGEFISSERNGPAAGVYRLLGFSGPYARPQAGGSQWWEYKVGSAVPASLVEVKERTVSSG